MTNSFLTARPSHSEAGLVKRSVAIGPGLLGVPETVLRRVASTVAGAAIAIVLATGAAQAQALPVMTTSGYVQGSPADANGVTSFKGIPYAAPPVGPLRWRAPEPAPQWAGVLPAFDYGHSCLAAYQPDASQSEDCLTVNVWTPALKPDVPKPVMVYIYGGGFEFGTSASPTLDGSRLATHDVVVVTLNYRLGVLGFLAAPQLDQESGTSGAWGLLDQLAALRWVKRNIASFGGDPKRVTVFGESAGAHAVGLLLASPKARGLIHGAIMESGAFWDSEHGSIATHDEALARGSDFVAKFPGQDIRSVDAATINAAAPWNFSIDPGVTAFAPSVDGNVLWASPAEVFARGQALNVPLLAGWNAAEYAPFTARALPFSTPQAFNDAAANLFGSRCLLPFQALYPATDATQAQASSYQLDGDLIIAEQVWELLTLSRRHPRAANVYAYNFTYTSPYSPVASHAADIPFVWGTMDAVPPRFAPPGAADQQFSDLVMAYWTNFAHNGNPNRPGLPFWPAYKGVGSQVMRLNAQSMAAPNTDEDRFRFVASYRSHGRLPEAWRTLGAPGNEYPGIGCDTPFP